jgi:hypothetical protein
MAGFGEYEVRVRSIDTTGAYSGWLVSTISIDVTAYLATCYLGDLIDTQFASTTSSTPEILAVTNYSSTQIIQPEPQANFNSTEVIVILNP